MSYVFSCMCVQYYSLCAGWLIDLFSRKKVIMMPITNVNVTHIQYRGCDIPS